MLLIIDRMNHLRFADLMEVYIESNTKNGQEKYPYLSSFEQLLEVENDFHQYLSAVFFRQAGAIYFMWQACGHYVSALRIEPYDDGLLLCGLETAPSARGHGYASNLISAVTAYLTEQGSGKIYSHVSKNNFTSLKVHEKCGFQICKDYAVYSDGSVLHNSYTLIYKY